MKEVVIGFAESKQEPSQVQVFWKRPGGVFSYSTMTGPVSIEEEGSLTRSSTNIVNPRGQWIALYYAGYHSGQIHFELEDNAEARTASRMAFHIDIDPQNLPMQAAIRGMKFEVVGVDAVSLKYRWIEISD